MDGSVLVGWILLTVSFAGLYGAIRNESWLSVLTRSINPKAGATPIDPSSSGGATGGSATASGGTGTATSAAASPTGGAGGMKVQ